MPKFRLLQFVKEKKKQDIEFDFKDVQSKNPRNTGKTPNWLFSEDIRKKYIINNEKENKTNRTR